MDRRPQPQASADGASDASIIERSKADPELFTVVFDRHFRELRRYLAARVPTHVADDLASETFVAAFESRERFNLSHTSARPWLFGIAVRKLGRHWRTQERETRAYVRSAEPANVDDLDAVDARVSARPARAELLAGLGSLSDDDREVLLLYAWAELSYEEIAGALEVPLGTVKSRLSRARRTLLEFLAPGSGAEEREFVRGGNNGRA